MKLKPSPGDRVRYSRAKRIDPRIIFGTVTKASDVSVSFKSDGGEMFVCAPEHLTVDDASLIRTPLSAPGQRVALPHRAGSSHCFSTAISASAPPMDMMFEPRLACEFRSVSMPLASLTMGKGCIEPLTVFSRNPSPFGAA